MLNSSKPPRQFGAAWLADEYATREVMLGDATSNRWHEEVSRWPEAGVDAKLIETLINQAQRWRASDRAHRSIEKLRDPRAVAVVTGQQCGFLLGPCYTLYKAITAVQWAARSEAITGRPTVPIFWLQSEDHDAQEIGTAHVLDGDLLTSIAMPMSGHQRTSVAHRVLTPEVTAAFDRLERAWLDTEFGDEVIGSAKASWAPGRRVVDAFAETLYRLLGDLGIVVLDPRDPDLASLARPLHEQVIFEAAMIEETLDTQVERLNQLGFSVQIPLRSRATLSFFHPDGPEGPRYRLMRAGHDMFELSGRAHTLSADEIYSALNTAPECFSTSALSRPILQERWFPTVATVVGPGELSYFAQLPPLFSALGQRAPGVIPRGRARLWTASWRRAMLKGEFTEADLIDTRDDVLTRIGRDHETSVTRELRDQVLLTPLAALDHFIATVERSDRGVAQHATRTRRTLERSVGRLLDHHARATAQRLDRHILRLDRLRAALAPQRAPQERILSPLHFAALLGAGRLIDTLQTALSPETAGQLMEVELW